MTNIFKNPKGHYGYIKRQRNLNILYTLVMFGISAALFISGYMMTGTKKNWLTIVAVLGCLPASKMAVEAIMFIRAKGCSEAVHASVAAHVQELQHRYDLYLTSYAKNFQISHVVMKNKNLIGFTEDPAFDESACCEHLKNMFSKNGYKDITVKIFQDLDKYLERMEGLAASEADPQSAKVEEVLHLLENLSL